ncbi:MAG: U32 family peptidase [Kiritimatiellia bacterium]
MDCELLAPAGGFETALAAFAAGADAVYCGLSDFSARAAADNFTEGELKDLLRYVRAPGTSGRRRRVYVAFNTVVDEADFAAAAGLLARLDDIRPDALIVQDLGVARICRRYFPDLELHASTQLVAHNLEGVLALRELGFRRVVLARELSLAEIVSIAKRCGDTELEVFVHGALCYSVSGLCLFGAMEKGRSGNRGKCPYCCRQPYAAADGGKTLAFSMKDLRLGEDVRKLADAGVASLKIEGRMKSALYVASVTRYYRQILGPGEAEPTAADGGRPVTVADLETVFSRRTTGLYFDGAPKRGDGPSPLDSESVGHLGAEIGVVKRVTKDRDGLDWLRFHTARALERHDGLQFGVTADGRPVGMGIVEMRQAISRRPVFAVNAGDDVEVLLPPADAAKGGHDLAKLLVPGTKVYCSMSNAVKRMFPTPSFRPGDYVGDIAVEVEVTLERGGIAVRACADGRALPPQELRTAHELPPAKSPEQTYAGLHKAFSRLGGTDYRLGRLTVNDAERRFAPMSLLNELRRELVERLDAARAEALRTKLAAAIAPEPAVEPPDRRLRTLKLRPDQAVPPGDWDELIVAIGAGTVAADLADLTARTPLANVRLALPVYTAEPDFNRLRVAVRRLLRAGFVRWEASDLATLRMLRALGVADLTADWTLYAFNSQALAALAQLGVRRSVASPENGRENLRRLAGSGHEVEFLAQQSTPLFVSLTQPAARPADLAVFRRDGLWVTTRPVPRTFAAPTGGSVRIDLSWDPPAPTTEKGGSEC